MQMGVTKHQADHLLRWGCSNQKKYLKANSISWAQQCLNPKMDMGTCD